MQVASTTAATTTAATASAEKSATVDYDAFLKLLIAQLRNQDPTKPTDSAQYISQLASFSNVEQAVKTNAKLDSLMSSFALTQAQAFVGRTVTSADGTVSGEVIAVRVTSNGAVAILGGGKELVLGPGITVT